MKTSEWRRYLNTIILPSFENRLICRKPRVLDIGKSRHWDYRHFFPKSEFIVSDIDESLNPDVVDDIRNTEFESNSFDGVIFNGVYEQIKTEIGIGINSIFNVSENLEKILKKDGLLLFGAPGSAFPRYGEDRDTGKRISGVIQAIDLITPLKVLEVKAFYNEKGLQYIYIIAIKK